MNESKESVEPTAIVSSVGSLEGFKVLRVKDGPFRVRVSSDWVRKKESHPFMVYEDAKNGAFGFCNGIYDEVKFLPGASIEFVACERQGERHAYVLTSGPIAVR